MNYDELNEYIRHYIEKDKTKSAIMLTGAWGIGKSYYIHNYLEPFLKDNKHRCATISLYGLKSLSEISKNIYFELRSIGFSKKSEAKTTGGVAAMIVGKTILNGLTSKIGFDIATISDDDLEKVYSSINLSGVLVILEDLERSNINIIDVLGYVNSLVEQDGVKVLLVANEDEILKYYDSQPDKDGKTHKIADEKTAMYLKAKEKTISDTILFNGNTINAIQTILTLFEDTSLNRFRTIESIKTIQEIMKGQRNYNLRTFLFACQKTVDIFEKLESCKNMLELDNVSLNLNDYLESIFYGNITFLLKIKDGDYPNWTNNKLISTKLGSIRYPIYRFCYEYIRWQYLNYFIIKSSFDEYRMQDPYNYIIKECDNDLDIIFNFYTHYEHEVILALKNVENRLENPQSIPLYLYEKLAFYLIKCHCVLKFDYIMCKKKMAFNLYCLSDKIDFKKTYWHLPAFGFSNTDESNQFKNFVRELNEAKRQNLVDSSFDFSYNPEDLIDFYTNLNKNQKQMISGHNFISKFDLNNLIDMIFECSPLQLNYFRMVLLEIYTNCQKDDFYYKDYVFMDELKKELENKIKSIQSSLDKILLYQIKGLIGDLKQFIRQIS